MQKRVQSPLLQEFEQWCTRQGLLAKWKREHRAIPSCTHSLYMETALHLAGKQESPNRSERAELPLALE